MRIVFTVNSNFAQDQNRFSNVKNSLYQSLTLHLDKILLPNALGHYWA